MDGKRYKYYRSLEYETVLRKERDLLFCYFFDQTFWRMVSHDEVGGRVMAKCYVVPEGWTDCGHYWVFDNEESQAGKLYYYGECRDYDAMGVKELQKNGCTVLTEEEYVLHVLESKT